VPLAVTLFPYTTLFRSVKQYQKLFQMDNVELEFEEDALAEIAKSAMERKTGARGLRSIIESIMLDIMFELPSREDIEKCIITKRSEEHTSELQSRFYLV